MNTNVGNREQLLTLLHVISNELRQQRNQHMAEVIDTDPLRLQDSDGQVVVASPLLLGFELAPSLPQFPMQVRYIQGGENMTPVYAIDEDRSFTGYHAMSALTGISLDEIRQLHEQSEGKTAAQIGNMILSMLQRKWLVMDAAKNVTDEVSA